MTSINPEEASIQQSMQPFTAEEWAQTPESVQGFVLAMLHRLQELESEVARLKEQIKQNSQNSSQPPSSDPPSSKKPKQTSEVEKRKPGGQPGHAKHERELLPIEQVKEVIAVKPVQCRSCGSQLSGEDSSPRRRQVTEIPPLQAETTEYQLHSLLCPDCHTSTCAPLPAGVPTGAFGPRLQAMVALLGGRYHLSKRDSCQLMDDFFQVDLSLGTISTLETKTSEALAQPVTEARAYVQNQAAIHLDETGWYENNQRAWLWVAATQWIAVFLIHGSRGSQVAKQLVGDTSSSIVHSDRWSAYNWIPNHLRQLCWAHLKRDFQAFAEREGPSALIGEQLLTQLDLLFDAWHAFRQQSISRTELQDTLQPVQLRVAELLRLGADSDHSKTAGTCSDILKRQTALWSFLYHEGVDPTNNFAERQIRPAVLWRKISFGTQSQSGSRFVERLMTVVASLKLQKRNTLAFLVDACHAANALTSPPSLLPFDST